MKAVLVDEASRTGTKIERLRSSSMLLEYFQVVKTFNEKMRNEKLHAPAILQVQRQGPGRVGKAQGQVLETIKEPLSG